MIHQVRSILPLLGFVALAMACEDKTSSRPPDASGSGTGGSGGAGARGGFGGAGASGGSGAQGGGGAGGVNPPVPGPAGGAGGQGGAGGVGGSIGPGPVPTSDAAGDSPPRLDGTPAVADGPAQGVPDGPIIGPGPLDPNGPCRADCMALYKQYVDELLLAQRCDPGASGQCRSRASGNLGCGGCRAWVQDTSEIAAVAANWAAGCSGCRFYEVAGRCHPIICSQLEIPVCKQLPTGGGTCVNMERERPCPPETKNNVPCDSDKYDYCHGQTPGTKICTCYPQDKFWRCY
jgi:hypothetical protein